MPTLPQPTPSARQGQQPKSAMPDRLPNPSQWLNFSLPPRQRHHVPGSGIPGGVPRRSRKGESWRGGAMSRERYVHANFRFVLKPTEVGSYGAHFADPDISLHWPHILQVLVPTFSAFSVAQGYVSSDPAHPSHEDELGVSLDESELEGLGEDAARVRQRMEEERKGRMCPICLGKPVAGRMTKCGHIFCFPCIMHYIRLSDIPGSAKCPICGDTVHEGMLKSVKYLDAAAMIRSAKGDDEDDGLEVEASPTLTAETSYGAQAHEQVISGHMDGFDDHPAPYPQPGLPEDDHPQAKGQQIHMRLLQRPQMTTLALPSSPTFPSDVIPPHTAPWYFLPDVLAFSRFMLATPEYMRNELQRELDELQAEWNLLKGDDLGRDFVRAAREKVERQVDKVRAELMTDGVKRGEREAREAWAEAVGGEKKEREKRKERERLTREREEKARLEPIPIIPAEEIPQEFLALQSPYHNPYANIPPNLTVEPNPMPSPSAKRSRRRPQPHSAPTQSPPVPSYHFYQSSLGANVFLHPLDIRILLAHFQSYSLFPPTLSFTSAGFDPGTINDDLRKRCKYLAHLPAGTEVVFVEADLETIVGAEALAAFEQPLKARRLKRRTRVQKEDRAKTRSEKIERDKLPASGPNREDREFMTALARSAAIDNTLHWGSTDGMSMGTSPGSASTQSHPGASPSTSPGTRTGGAAIWGRPTTFASAALHPGTGSSVRRAAAVPREKREGTGEEEDEWDVQAAWDAAFEDLSLEEARYGARVTVKGGPGVRKGGRGEEEEDLPAVGAGGSAGPQGGGKKGGKKNRKVLVLGGGGPGTRR